MEEEAAGQSQSPSSPSSQACGRTEEAMVKEADFLKVSFFHRRRTDAAAAAAEAAEALPPVGPPQDCLGASLTDRPTDRLGHCVEQAGVLLLPVRSFLHV